MITLAEVHVVDGYGGGRAGVRADLRERRAAVHAAGRSGPLLLVRLLLAAGRRGRPVVLVQGDGLAQLLLPRRLMRRLLLLLRRRRLLLLLLLAVLRGSAHSESVSSRLNIIACR